MNYLQKRVKQLERNYHAHYQRSTIKKKSKNNPNNKSPNLTKLQQKINAEISLSKN